MNSVFSVMTFVVMVRLGFREVDSEVENLLWGAIMGSTLKKT